jgi:hypothetical protein
LILGNVITFKKGNLTLPKMADEEIDFQSFAL